jgi:uncharacterized membrane protein
VEGIFAKKFTCRRGFRCGAFFLVGISAKRSRQRLVAAGQGLPMIGKLLRHTQVQATARYVHLAVDHLFVTTGLDSADKRALTDWHYKAIAASRDIDNEPI